MPKVEDAEDTQQVRFLVISDTHSVRLGTDRLADLRLPLPEVGVVLHCGDLTSPCSLPELKAVVDLLGSISASLRLVIPGNHDTLLDPAFVDQLRDALIKETITIDVRDLVDSAAKKCVKFLDEGLHRFTLSNGAFFSVYASPYTPSQYGTKYGLHAFQYDAAEDRFNPAGDPSAPAYVRNIAKAPIPDYPAVDILMTHGPPKYILDESGDTSAGCEHLWRARRRARPRIHCFGHIHASHGVQSLVWTDAMSKEDREEILANVGMCVGDGMLRLGLEPASYLKNSSRRRGYAMPTEECLDSLEFGKRTLCVNAAIMDEHGEPANAPWLVTLRLPTRVSQASAT